MMLRRLLAILALVSGLTAVAVPAHAWGNSSDSSTVAAADQASSGTRADCECDERGKCVAATTTKRQKSPPKRKLAKISVPSVLIGADRSLE